MADANHDLTELLRQPGPWTTVLTDGRGERPQQEEVAKIRAVTDPLGDAGAPEADVQAVGEALTAGDGLPSPSTRYLLVRDGDVVIDEAFTGQRLGAEVLAHGAAPRILPLLRHRASAVRYLVVETAREGARLSVREAHRGDDGATQEIEGRTDSLNKVQAGGWSHRRYQNHSEDIWQHNQAEVADAVDRLVRERRPRFVVVAGDVRARQLLLERLAPPSRELALEVDAHTKAEGSADEALERAIDDAVGGAIGADIADARRRAAENDGAAGARGIGEVIDALQQARVDTLVLDARLADEGEDGEALAALDAEPWVARSEREELPAGSLGYLPAAEALARAALLSGARVLVVEEDLAEGEARDDRPAAEPVAALRWADGG
ncbi:Vms1/Ankzf1 family peptidyl-tRNA hydrolase [Microbacterium sp.]|uniref:baeRF2 domain-containing protein n=1 Tax=Microbacterium sp. TaxID=51671 RepID=UPI002811D9AC|nr:Vms1/Ankzf1 family peptidyl-tRNA hydrolase [Microbacterium sp.]